MSWDFGTDPLWALGFKLDLPQGLGYLDGRKDIIVERYGDAFLDDLIAAVRDGSMEAAGRISEVICPGMPFTVIEEADDIRVVHVVDGKNSEQCTRRIDATVTPSGCVVTAAFSLRLALAIKALEGTKPKVSPVLEDPMPAIGAWIHHPKGLAMLEQEKDAVAAIHVPFLGDLIAAAQEGDMEAGRRVANSLCPGIPFEVIEREGWIDILAGPDGSEGRHSIKRTFEGMKPAACLVSSASNFRDALELKMSLMSSEPQNAAAT